MNPPPTRTGEHSNEHLREPSLIETVNLDPGADAGAGAGAIEAAGFEGSGFAARRVRLLPASGVRLRPTYWLWDDRIPQGALVIGPGREGIGKSLFCAWLAARITLGELPGVYHGRPMGVVYAATEDSWERTLAGRLLAAGADMQRVYRVEVAHVSGETLPLSLPRDVDELTDAITDHGVALLILDPLISAVDSRINVNQEELRTALEPLAHLADQADCSVFGLAHFNKSTGTDVLSRITGSRAFSAVARAAIAFARDTGADDGTCVLSQAKNNLGRLDLPSLRYTVDSIELATEDGTGTWGRLRFLGETDTHVDALLREAETGSRDERDERAEVDAWLTDYLIEQGGSATASDVFKQGHAAGGYGPDKLRRAKKRLGIVTAKTGMRGGWSWQIPAHTEDGTGPEGGTEDGEGGRPA